MSERRGVGRASRGVMREIEQRLGELDLRLAQYDELAAERDRLRRARATLLGAGDTAGDRSRRISQDEIAAYLADHPGSKASDIASELGVVLQTVSSHLYRGREIRFENGRDGWHLRERPGR